MTFSIIIPTYNRADHIGNAIQSVLGQDYPGFELIIVDDGSTDNTEMIVNGFDDPRVRYVKTTNRERGAARNTGIDLSGGEYISFLDSDDIFYPTALSNARSFIRQAGDPPFFHLGYQIGTPQEVHKTVNDVPDNDIFFLVKGNPLSCMGVFIHKNEAKKFRFTEDRELAGTEDWELWVRLAANLGLRTSPLLVGRMIEHEERSVVNYKESQLVKRCDLALEYMFNDTQVQQQFGKHRNKMRAYLDTYISLHLAMSRQKKRALHFLFSAFKRYVPALVDKRTLVISKFILFR